MHQDSESRGRRLFRDRDGALSCGGALACAVILPALQRPMTGNGPDSVIPLASRVRIENRGRARRIVKWNDAGTARPRARDSCERRAPAWFPAVTPLSP